MIKIIFFLCVFITTLSFAQEVKPLAMYFDCMEKTNLLTNSIPVFTRIGGRRIKETYSAEAFTKGIPIGITTHSTGEIADIRLGDKIKFSIEDFEKGIEFGVFNQVAHTLQLLDFNPSTGGTIEFGYLKNVMARKKEWGTYRVYLRRSPENNSWKIKDHASHDVKAIFGFMTMKNRFIVEGISGMDVMTEKSLSQELKCPSR